MKTLCGLDFIFSPKMSKLKLQSLPQTADSNSFIVMVCQNDNRKETYNVKKWVKYRLLMVNNDNEARIFLQRSIKVVQKNSNFSNFSLGPISFRCKKWRRSSSTTFSSRNCDVMVTREFSLRNREPKRWTRSKENTSTAVPSSTG